MLVFMGPRLCLDKLYRNSTIFQVCPHGPSHINLETSYSQLWNVKELPSVKVIRRVDVDGDYPVLPSGKIALFVGSHKRFTDADIEAIDDFCYNHNAVVFCDHTSNYKGQFRQMNAMLSLRHAGCMNGIDLLIHLGEISGDHAHL